MAPIAKSESLSAIVDKYVNSNRVMIFSKSTCPFCEKVKELFKSLGVEFFALELNSLDNGADMQKAMAGKTGRSSVPQVFINQKHVGGCDDTMAAHKSGKLLELLQNPAEGYDYDLVVVGGGSGGLSASKEAARLGKKVAVLDFVTPTPRGTTWGLGGTCVNVGCIPKKLMHQAALSGRGIRDSLQFGWNIPENVTHKWESMRENVQNYIKSLNWSYKVQLRTSKVTYINSHGEFVDDHQIKAVDKTGKEKLLTSKHFIISTGERPRYPDCEGAKEYGITSDDIFSLESSPGKTLVVGASYVALECAGFLSGIGLDVTVMVRSILLRGFDQDMAEMVGKYMEIEGIKFVRPCIPKKIEKAASGSPHKLKVTAVMGSGEEIAGEFDTVLFAIGRDACTDKIGLDKVGVKVNPKNGKIPTQDEQTNIPNIYAIGDVVEGKPELTPVAIEAGLLLAQRLYANSDTKCDYLNIPTTIFTPLEYGCIGYSEEAAIEEYGNENIEVYHTNILPLEWTVNEGKGDLCYAKVICLIPENEKIIGLHYLGPNAGEITQGFALGIKKGATKADLDATIGIHPTCAEAFTTLSVTKRSGKSIIQEGC